MRHRFNAKMEYGEICTEAIDENDPVPVESIRAFAEKCVPKKYRKYVTLIIREVGAKNWYGWYYSPTYCELGTLPQHDILF